MKILFQFCRYILTSFVFIFFISLFSTPMTAEGYSKDKNSIIVLHIGDTTETLSSLDIDNLTHFNTTIYPLLQYQSTIENIDFCPTNTLFCQFSLSLSKRHSFALNKKRTLDIKAIQSFIAMIAEKTKKDPIDAQFTFINGRVVITGKEQLGQILNEEESIKLLSYTINHLENIQENINLPFTSVEPKITTKSIEELKIKELIGEGTTNFKGSTKNRIYNIERALKQFQNIIIAPNEEFSFVEHLGEVDGEHGYLPELVIKNNQTTPEFGGGICQVSSTVFRTAIYSGLKITARRNHAYPVHYYYPYGMDATVYLPKPDLTFINNTPASILMQSTIEGTKLTFRFYGTNDGREIKVDGPHILEHNPDGSMKTVFTQEVNNADGKNFIRDSFFSNYKSPSLFPQPGQEQIFTTKPNNWSLKQWNEYKKIHP